MKIIVIGGGPAGLYFACSVKKRIRNAEVQVIEKYRPDNSREGLGYTLQLRTKELLTLLDPDYFTRLFRNRKPPCLHRALVRVDDATRVMDFYEGHGMRRTALLEYLRDYARELGVRLVYHPVTEALLQGYERESDLLVGADGLRSVVRKKYAGCFVTQELQENTHYIWLTNTSPRKQTDVRFLVKNQQGAVLVLSSYPLSDRTQAVIVEGTARSLERAGLFSMEDSQGLSGEGLLFLNRMFSYPDDPLTLGNTGKSWAPYIMNSCGQLYTGNIALIGDAAISFHYSLGAGLSSAFGMGHILARHLAFFGVCGQALERFSQSVKNWLAATFHASSLDLKWMGELDTLYRRVPAEKIIDAFLEKSRFEC